MKLRLLIGITALLLASCTAFLPGERSEQGIEEDPSRRTIGTLITDEEIEALVRNNLNNARETLLRDSHIDVTAHRGIVLLVGQVPSPEMKQRAVEIASEASSQVRRIHDELEVTGNTGFFARLNDESISLRVRLRLTDETVSDANIRPVTENGTVYLLGVVSREQGDQAAALISDINGVTRVVKVFEYLN